MAGDPGRAPAPQTQSGDATEHHAADSSPTSAGSHNVTFTSKGAIPPVAATGGSAGAHAPSASDQAFGDHHDAKKKAKPSGFSKSGGGTVRDALTRLANAGKLKINAHQIAQLDALAQVETGGQVASVDTTDDMVVSIGFHQVVLGHKSVEWVINKAHAAFAKHGIELDMSKTYPVKGWSHPHQIKGVEDPDDLRGHEWGDRFYAASLEDEVIVAITEWALKEAKEVEAKATHAGSAGSFWEDDTAKTWLLEVDNNREAYTSPVVKRAVALGANNAKDRDAFLDILSKAIVDTYEELEPKLVGYPALKRKFPHEDDAKLHELAKTKYASIGRTKGTHIVTRISRHLKVPTLDVAAAAPAPVAAPPAKTAAPPAAEHHAEPEVHHEPPPAIAKHDAPAPTHHDAVTAAPAQSPAAPAPAEPAHAAPEANATSPHTFTGPAHLRVTATGLNVRSSPSTHDHHNVIGGLHHGDAIEAVERHGEWIAITYKGQQAYVHGGFVEAIPAQVKNAEQVAKNPEHAPAPSHEAPPPPTVATAAHHGANTEAHHDVAAEHHETPAHHDAKPEAHHDAKPQVAAHTAPPATRAHHDGPAHHDAAATHHEPAAPAPAPHAETPKPAHDAEAVRGHYHTLLAMLETGFMQLEVAVAQLIAFDRGLHNGQMSPTGVELVAGFPMAIAQHQLAKSSEHAPAEGHAAAPQPAAAPHPAAPAGPHPAAPAPHADHPATAAPAAPAVAPHVEAPPAAKHAPADTSWSPPAGSRLTDPHLLGLAAKIHDPRVQPLVEHLGGMMQESTLAKKQTGGGNSMEYTNPEHRDALVRSIGVVRSELEQLDGNDPNVAAFKVAAYHEIERISPYHFQKNIRAIETWDKAKDKGGKRQWTTCNLTSLSMCLEVVGINARNFPAEHHALLEQVAKVFEGDINEGKDDQGDPYAGAILTAKGKGTSLDKVQGFRLPDFMELAAVVYATVTGGYAHDEHGIVQGAADAATQKGQISFLKGLAKFMGATASGVNLVFDSDAKKNAAITKKLEKFGQDHRGIHTDGVEKMNTQRNLMENAEAKEQSATNDKDKKRHSKEHGDAKAYYEKLDKTQHRWLDDPEIEKTLPIEAYKNAVTSQLGKHLDAGKGVIAGLAGHYVRLYEVTPDHVCVQDPGQWNRTEMRITWAEARAMGYFWVNLVIAS